MTEDWRIAWLVAQWITPPYYHECYCENYDSYYHEACRQSERQVGAFQSPSLAPTARAHTGGRMSRVRARGLTCGAGFPANGTVRTNWILHIM